MAGPAPLVRVLRSGVEESVHLGHVAVCDAGGRLLASAGDPGHVAFVRSCMKPVQAAVSLAAIDDPGLTDAQVAIMCASHNGEPVHLRAVRSVLRRAGLTPAALRTPADRPIDPTAAASVRTPTPLHHNCSGKHAGMLLACARRGWSLASYRSPGHPLQRRVLGAVRSLAGEEPVVGIDGCGVPVHGLPLRAIATMFARVGSNGRAGAPPDGTGGLGPMLERAIDAMRTEPYLVGGRHRDDTAVMRAVPGVVMKEGAEALDCLAVPAEGIGIAVKVADGGYRAAGPAAIETLAQLGLLPPSAERVLERQRRPAVIGGGRTVGRLEPTLRLRVGSRP
jgi:L-asparaginase II